MKLTQDQLNVLNECVVDGQAWADHVEATFDTAKAKEALLAKVAKNQANYDKAVAKGNYKDRKQRDDAQAQAEQDRYDNAGYKEKRRRSFASIGDQLDMQYKDLLNGTATWKDHVAKVKSDNPKG